MGASLRKGGRIAKHVEISLNKHATESDEKVLAAAESLLPRDLRGKVRWVRTAAHGHYGNPISIYRATITGDDAETVARHIFGSMEKGSLKYLISTLDSRVDPYDNLHIRLHKQYLYDGRLIVWDGDDIVKVVIKLNIDKEELVELLRSAVEDG